MCETGGIYGPFFFLNNSLVTCLRKGRVGQSYVRKGGMFSDETEKKKPQLKLERENFEKKLSTDSPDI